MLPCAADWEVCSPIAVVSVCNEPGGRQRLKKKNTYLYVRVQHGYFQIRNCTCKNRSQEKDWQAAWIWEAPCVRSRDGRRRLRVPFPCSRRLMVLADIAFPPACISINHRLVSALLPSSPPRRVPGSTEHTCGAPMHAGCVLTGLAAH